MSFANGTLAAILRDLIDLSSVPLGSPLALLFECHKRL